MWIMPEPVSNGGDSSDPCDDETNGSIRAHNEPEVPNAEWIKPEPVSNDGEGNEYYYGTRKH